MILLLGLLSTGFVFAVSAQSSNPATSTQTEIRLRWGPRTGVSRYRLQLSANRGFTDIVFDRIVNGTETVIDDLPAGRYYWRVAALTAHLGEFSSPTMIVVTGSSATNRPKPRPLAQPTPRTDKSPAGEIETSGGWRAAVGNISQPVLAHLRGPDRLDVVGTNSDGVTYALDALNGAALWTVRGSAGPSIAPVVIQSRTSGRENIVLFAGLQVIAIEGSSGSELWRATISAPAQSAVVIADRGGPAIVVLDSTLQRVTILADDGRIVSQIKLAGRAVGGPTPVAKAKFAIAYESGEVEIRDNLGRVMRSGNTGSATTTAPLLVRSARGDLLLVGSRDGLTALMADDLNPIGRVSLKNDMPRGTLAAADVNGDGAMEVLMTTARRHLIAVNTANGKILWDVLLEVEADVLTFADINGDGAVDVFIAAGPAFAAALSGRDGTIIWKAPLPGGSSANHPARLGPRTLIALPTAGGIMLIGSEPSSTDLRAITFPRAADRRGLS